MIWRGAWLRRVLLLLRRFVEARRTPCFERVFEHEHEKEVDSNAVLLSDIKQLCIFRSHLASVSNADYPVAFEGLEPVLNRRHIGRVVSITAWYSLRSQAKPKSRGEEKLPGALLFVRVHTLMMFTLPNDVSQEEKLRRLYIPRRMQAIV